MTLPPRPLACLAVALCLAGPAVGAEDYATLKVLDSEVLPLMAGPVNTVALLSPDGTRVLHIGTSGMCLLEPTDAWPWTDLGCVATPPPGYLTPAEDLFWSPDGNFLLLPTFGRAFFRYEDTDVDLLTSYSLMRRVLTDDGVEGEIEADGPGRLDVATRWLDTETIAFLRYPEGIYEDGAPVVMTIAADGSAEQRLFDLPAAGRGLVYSIAVSADGKTLAYSLDDRNNPDSSGIWITPLDGSSPPERLAAMADIGPPPRGLAFSADGTHLLTLGQDEDPAALSARVVGLATGEVSPVHAGERIIGAAWSPTGSALAYLTFDESKPDAPGGLFLADTPGEPGRLLLAGPFMPPVCCGQQPFVWASNNTMILGRAGDGREVTFVRLGQ